MTKQEILEMLKENVPLEVTANKVDMLIEETCHRNRKELAQDIKRRHWVNDKLRDSYLNAVISVSNEALKAIKERWDI